NLYTRAQRPGRARRPAVAQVAQRDGGRNQRQRRQHQEERARRRRARRQPDGEAQPLPHLQRRDRGGPALDRDGVADRGGGQIAQRRQREQQHQRRRGPAPPRAVRDQ